MEKTGKDHEHQAPSSCQGGCTSPVGNGKLVKTFNEG